MCFKVGMKSAFNLVSRQAIFGECAIYFPELFKFSDRVSFCYMTAMASTWTDQFGTWSAAG